MRLFKKKPTANSTLAELESYYGVKRGNSNSRHVLSSALIATVTVFCLAALLFSLFLGGRWLYRKTQDNDQNKDVSSAQTTPTPTSKPTTSAAQSTPTPTAKPSTTPTPKSTPTPTPKATPTPTPTPTPVATHPAALPSTGPDSDN